MAADIFYDRSLHLFDGFENSFDVVKLTPEDKDNIKQKIKTRIILRIIITNVVTSRLIFFIPDFFKTKKRGLMEIYS